MSSNGRTEVVIHVPPERIKRLEDPYHREFVLYEALVDIREAAKIPIGAANPREQDTGSRIAREIRASLEQRQDEFHLLNRGLWVIASDAKYDNETKTLTLDMPRVDGQEDSIGGDGIADGGHTQAVIKEFLEATKDTPQNEVPYVHVHVRAGIQDGMLPDMVKALNRSVQLREFTLANYVGRFEEIRKILDKDENLRGSIAYRENEEKPYDITEILQRILLFCDEIYPGDSDRHPLEAYKNEAKCLDRYIKEEDQKKILALEPVMVECIRLPDKIERLLPEVGTVRPSANAYIKKVPERHPETADTLKGLPPPPGLPEDKRQEWSWARPYRFPKAILYPFAAALRVLLVRVATGKYEWLRDPVEFFLATAGKEMFKTWQEYRSTQRDAQELGRDNGFWAALYNRAYRCFVPRPSIRHR